ncbi:MAG TPA: rhodanese-like domain-containing protein [Solirubrobacteraceae bacterium]|jgi:glyoxylase-like metal-dependent hydrolase (beta-lactamase superfamily II)/rhodanese-related sulfurtransferase|nr:rhodanese-like domain-containing protein [Solirubrobacteraceae bacterium]
MIFRQVLYPDLGCASYLLGDRGEAVVVDPRFDIDVYLDLAREEGVRIAHVIDTHQHADHLSGRERLAARTGARAYCGPDLLDGATIAVGRLRLRVLRTPGHRPEHLSLVAEDLARGADPWLVLTGDSLLVGDVARPDLAVEPRDGAAALHGSLRRVLELGDHVELWPGHVGGSLCGGGQLSAKTSSTVGYERRHNPLLAMEGEEFVASLTREPPPRPPNLARIVWRNERREAAEPPVPGALSAADLAERHAAGAVLVDGRSPEEFDGAHLPGAINLPSGRSLGTRAGWVLDPDQPLVVLAADAAQGRALLGALHAVGLWRIEGLALCDPLAWRAAGLTVERGVTWHVASLAAAVHGDEASVVDVRERSEWTAGHVAGSAHLPLHALGAGRAPLPVDRPLAVACAAGRRAAFAASVLRRRGHREVIRVHGGGIADLPRWGVELIAGA